MKEWHCVLFGQPQGPFDEGRLREMIGRGEIAGDTLVWCGTTPEDAARGWIRAGESEIAPILAEAPPRLGAPAALPRGSAEFQRLALSGGVDLRDGWQFRASRLRRLWAFALDILIGLAFSVVFMAAPILALRGEPLSLALKVFVATAVSFAVYGAANFILLCRRGQSISKNIAGVRIVNVDGSRTPLWKIILLRNGVYIAFLAAQGVSSAVAHGLVTALPLPPPGFQRTMALAAGAFFVLDSCLILGPSRRTLHDRFAGTIVVDA